MQKALIVKDDGLIYAAEVPEEPKYEHYGSTQDDTEDFWDDVEEHKKALASAKESAVLVSDQKEAKRFVWYNQTGGYVNIHDFVLKPGIYPIPDLQWEVKDVPIERDPSTFTYYEREAGRQLVTEFTKVAILL